MKLRNDLEDIIKEVKKTRNTGPVKGTPYFFKAETSRLSNQNQKYGIEISAEDDYHTLVKLHKVLPENTPEPISMVRDDFGKVIGYLMTRVPGKTLGKHLYIQDEAKEKLIFVLNRLSQSGIVHGDIRSKNIMCTDDNVYLIDPMGTDCYPNVREKDAQQDRMFSKSIINAFPSVSEVRGNPYRALTGIIDRIKYIYNARVAYHVGRRGSSDIKYSL